MSTFPTLWRFDLATISRTRTGNHRVPRDAVTEAREVVRTAEMVKRSSHGGSLAIGPNRERQAMEEPRKLYRSRSQRMVAGVCGGLAEYFNVDATLIRVLFLVLAVVGGSGLVIYLLMWIIVPDARKMPPPT